MPIANSAEEAGHADWPCTDVFSVLGHTLTPDGSSEVCRQATIRAAWRAFWANLSGSARRHMSVALRFNLLKRSVVPIIFNRAARWPFVKSHAAKLDNVQRRMARHILSLKPYPSEDIASFHMRASRTAASYCKHEGLWSVRWAEAVVAWTCHILRNTNAACWATPLIGIRTVSELSERRSCFDGRPHVRKCSGFMPRRYLESVRNALDFLHVQKVPLNHLFDRSIFDDGTPSSPEDLLSRL